MGDRGQGEAVGEKGDIDLTGRGQIEQGGGMKQGGTEQGGGQNRRGVVEQGG